MGGVLLCALYFYGKLMSLRGWLIGGSCGLTALAGGYFYGVDWVQDNMERKARLTEACVELNEVFAKQADISKMAQKLGYKAQLEKTDEPVTRSVYLSSDEEGYNFSGNCNVVIK